MKILSFGEILWDVYQDSKFLGGAPLNFASHIKKHGEDVFMMSAVGNDSLGDEAIKYLKENGICTKYLSVLDDKPTGKCIVALDENKVPTYNLLDSVAYDYIPYNEITDDFDVLYFGTLALRNQNNYNSLKRVLNNNQFKEVFVDVNIRPPFYSKEIIEFCLRNATVLKISSEEKYAVLGEIGLERSLSHRETADILKEKYKNLSCIIITLGADGAYVLNCSDYTEYRCTSPKTAVKSTVGAGDSFSSAFLHQYMRGSDIQYCIEYASRIASYVVSQYDAVPDYDIKDFI